MNIEDVFTPLSEAMAEIKRRSTDAELIKKVHEYIGADIQLPDDTSPRCVYFRVVLTPNFETRYFNDVAKLTGFEPLCFEFPADKFCSNNKDKVYLGKMVFAHENPNKQIIHRKERTIDFHHNENRQFDEIETLNGNSFLDLHHGMYEKEYGRLMETFDISALKKKGYNIKEIYKRVFAFCVVKGILFENMIVKEDQKEKKFVEDIMVEVYKEVRDHFGLKPLIVPLLPFKNEDMDFWMWYPTHLEQEYKKLNPNKNATECLTI